MEEGSPESTHPAVLSGFSRFGGRWTHTHAPVQTQTLTHKHPSALFCSLWNHYCRPFTSFSRPLLDLVLLWLPTGGCTIDLQIDDQPILHAKVLGVWLDCLAHCLGQTMPANWPLRWAEELLSSSFRQIVWSSFLDCCSVVSSSASKELLRKLRAAQK